MAISATERVELGARHLAGYEIRHLAADNRLHGRYLGLRRRTPRVFRQLRKNELLKDTGERRLTKSD